jgi:hypothetical protein
MNIVHRIWHSHVLFGCLSLAMACVGDPPASSSRADAGGVDAAPTSTPFCQDRASTSVFCDDFAGSNIADKWELPGVGFTRAATGAQADGTGSMSGMASANSPPSAVAKVPDNVGWTRAQFAVRISKGSTSLALVDLDLTDTAPCQAKLVYKDGKVHLENNKAVSIDLDADLTKWTTLTIDLNLAAANAMLTVQGGQPVMLPLPSGCTEKSINLLATGNQGEVSFDNVILSDPP